jgi:hypothetical protein
MEPLTMAAAAASVGGGVMGFKGNQAAAKNARAVAEYNAKVRENELILEQRQKVEEEKNLRQQSDRLAATQRVATAASGVQMSGSPLQALADTYFKTEQDALKIQYASDIAKTKAEADATLARAEGAARASALKTQSYQQLLQGVSQGATLLG